MHLVMPTGTGSFPDDQPSVAWTLGMGLLVMSLGTHFPLAFLRYLGDLAVAGIDELVDLALDQARYSEVVALPLVILIVVIAD